MDYVLELSDGTEVPVTSEVRDVAGANESYHGGGSSDASGSAGTDMDHKGHDH